MLYRTKAGKVAEVVFLRLLLVYSFVAGTDVDREAIHPSTKSTHQTVYGSCGGCYVRGVPVENSFHRSMVKSVWLHCMCFHHTICYLPYWRRLNLELSSAHIMCRFYSG